MKGSILSSVVQDGGLRMVISVLDDGRELGPFCETWGAKDNPTERLAGFMGLQEYSRQAAIDSQETPDDKLRAVLKEVDPEVAKRVLRVDDAKLAELVDDE